MKPLRKVLKSSSWARHGTLMFYDIRSAQYGTRRLYTGSTGELVRRMGEHNPNILHEKSRSLGISAQSNQLSNALGLPSS
jgi:hypothetical protein